MRQINRNESGVYLIEALMAVTIGSLIMIAVYGGAMSSYRASTLSQNQILATNMAQQMLDNTRNCTYSHLTTLLGSNNTYTESIGLYSYPANPANSVFQRPLLRNEDANAFTYASLATKYRFNGTANETLTKGSDANSDGIVDTIKASVTIAWTDSTGAHQYTTATTICQSGIHN